METLSVKEFREKHGCKSCLYYSKTKKCIAERNCPLEADIVIEKKKCPLDEDGLCPYGNEAETCFGFCVRTILKEYREKVRKYEQTKEDKESG